MVTPRNAIVIGAGVIGCSVALELSRRNHRVTVVDALPAAGYGSTSSSSGIIRFHYSTEAGVAMAWEGRHYWWNWAAHVRAEPGPDGSPVIGFAADGFPVYGSYFLDPDSGAVRKAVSGYTLKAGNRPISATDPGGVYDGRYIDDYEFTDSGDLDACNGMTVNGQYGYYVTDAYPWVIACFLGTPDPSFNK